MEIFFILISFAFSLIMYCAVSVFAMDNLSVSLIIPGTDGIFNSIAKFFFSEGGVFFTAMIAVAFAIFTVVMLFRQKENKKLSVCCFVLSLLSIIFVIITAFLPASLQSFTVGTAMYNLYLGICILSVILLVAQLVMSLVNGVKCFGAD